MRGASAPTSLQKFQASQATLSPSLLIPGSPTAELYGSSSSPPTTTTTTMMSTESITAASAQFSYPAATYFPIPFHLQNAYQNPNVALAYTAAYHLPQYHQIITSEALASVKAAITSSEIDKKAEAKKKAIPRKAAGQTWEDPTLADWPENDFRLFCGDLGNEVNDDVLSKAFSKYPSFNKARVVRDKWTGKTKGYGFVSFANVSDLAAALKEMNGKYIGNRPIKLRKSTWKNRIDYEALERQKTDPRKRTKQQKRSILHK
ncbi:RNA-binding protein 42-like isoform X2 [Ananas comosus]|uniref:RNA-binding protein 42-like isoform X2 n=1 Tax=Ananas comosus TaxID=4615 RepID=A0A6P5EU66_ANACO|nr:RNA-binding protein 42-like isoform X2 [Ananas comosus]